MPWGLFHPDPPYRAPLIRKGISRICLTWAPALLALGRVGPAGCLTGAVMKRASVNNQAARAVALAVAREVGWGLAAGLVTAVVAGRAWVGVGRHSRLPTPPSRLQAIPLTSLGGRIRPHSPAGCHRASFARAERAVGASGSHPLAPSWDTAWLGGCSAVPPGCP